MEQSVAAIGVLAGAVVLLLPFDLAEQPAPAPDRPRSNMAIVTPEHFGAMGVPLQRSGDFSERDDAQAPRVVIANQAFVRV